MIDINIAKEFSNKPGARDYDDGIASGKEFYDKILKRKFEDAMANNTKLRIIMDGTEGYASSFINEAFSLLGTEFGAEKVWKSLVIISREIPKYIEKVKKGVYEFRK